MDNLAHEVGPGAVLLRSEAGVPALESVPACARPAPRRARHADESRQTNRWRGGDPVGRLGVAYDAHRNNFGFLRFFLASTVIWSHSYALSGRSEPVAALSGQADAGSLAVDGFFVLSGFLVTQSWIQQPSVRAFAAKRFLRLVPALVVATVFGAFVIGPLGTALSFGDYVGSSGPWLHFLGVLLIRYLYIPASFANNPLPHLLNTPLWSLRFEILCYTLVGLLGAVWDRHLGKVATWVFVFSWLVYVCLPASISPLSILFNTPRLLACFSAGMVLFIYRSWVPIGPRWALLAALVLGVTFVTGGLRSTLPWAGAYLLIYFACLRGSRLENFCRYGDFSYGLYILACPIQQLLLYYLGPQIPVSAFFGLAFLPTLGLAVLSWRFVEAPALALKPKAARSQEAGKKGMASAPYGAVSLPTQVQGSNSLEPHPRRDS